MTGENKMDIEQIMRLIDKVSESSVTEVAVEEGSLKSKRTKLLFRQYTAKVVHLHRL